MRSDETLAFEQAVLSLRQDGHSHHRQMSLALPPYLQALLLAYSEELHADAERYFHLIDELLKLPTRVLFVSLNYDTLLDTHLSAFGALQSIGDYISAERQWSLVKPHGSANWYVELAGFFDPAAPAADLEVPLGPIQSVPTRSFALHIVRGTRHAGQAHDLTNRYPAIALPEGPKDVLALPSEHLDFFTSQLMIAAKIDLLILGYSALDTEVLDLIASSNTQIRRMTIVNRDPEANLEVYRAIERHGLRAIWTDTFDGGYGEWVDDVGLKTWVEEFDGPYHSLTTPDRLRDAIDLRSARQDRDRRKADEDNPMNWRF